MSEWLIWQLADSAFPAGSFAHSCGLEAAWQAGEVRDVDGLRQFVREVIWQAGRGSLPLLTSAHRMPVKAVVTHWMKSSGRPDRRDSRTPSASTWMGLAHFRSDRKSVV